MAGRLTAFVTETDPWDAKVDIASKYGNGWMRLNRSGNYKDTINVLPEEVRLSELAKSDIKDIKLDILNDYFGRTLITPQGNLARIIIKTHKDPTWLNRKVKPKFLYSIDAATGREVKDTENFKPGTGFVFADDPETKVRASFVEETVGEGSEKVTYHGFNRARYKNVKKQLYPAWTCTEEPGVATMAFVGRKGNDKVYSDIVFYRVNRRQSKINFVQLDGNNGTISKTYYSLDIVEDYTFDIGGKQYIAIYQPEMAMIRSGDGELVPLEVSATPAGDYIPAPNDSLSELMYNDIVSQHSLATRANINEYTPIGGELPGVITTSTNFWWFDRTDRMSKSVVDVPISKVDYTPSKLGLKTAQEWKEIEEANSLYDDTPIWLAELIIPLSDKLAIFEITDELSGTRRFELFKKTNRDARLQLRIPFKPVSGPISKDLDNYFGFIPINSQYLEIANGPHVWRGPLKTSAGEISRIPNEAKQLKGKVTFQGDKLGFMGVIYRGLVNNTIGARKWLEWIVNLWLTTYWPKTRDFYNSGVSEVNCQLRTTDGVRYSANLEVMLGQNNKKSFVIENLINLDTIEVVYHKDMAAYRDNVFKQRDPFIGTANLNNVDEVVELLRNKLPVSPREGATPNKEYWMKYIIPRLDYKSLFMRVGVMTDGSNMRPTYACQDIPLHGFLHTGLSYLNKIPENNPDNRKANAVYSMFVVQGEWSQQTEYYHDGLSNYMNGSRGRESNPTGYFRLPANVNAQSIVSNYNFDKRNTNATYLARGDGWGFTGPNDKDNWHRGNLHSLVNFEPAPTARLFKDNAIYTMIPWEKGEVDYQYIRGYLHGSLVDSNIPFLKYSKPTNNTGTDDIEFGGYFPCMVSYYFNGGEVYDRGAPPGNQYRLSSSNDITPLVRVKSQSPILPHEWKLYEGNVAEIIDATSSTLLENPLYDHTDMMAYYRQLFNGDVTYNIDPDYQWRRRYFFNKKDHPISTLDFHLDSINMLESAGGLVEQFHLPNYTREDSIWNATLDKNPRARSIAYTRRRGDELGIPVTFGLVDRVRSDGGISIINTGPSIKNSPQTWLITVGLDILIEYGKRNRGTPWDLKHLFKGVFDKHGIPEEKWLPDWEKGPGHFFTKNEIWLDYFSQASKLPRKDITIINDSTLEYAEGGRIPVAIDYQEKPNYRQRVSSDRL